ncbi:hypothetical protein GCM10009541_50270 [Micromonospora gifhornensis]|uniref:Uncharacterized protein n=1 Tax=Micromonospora gifhornensis TaxID=84594 RepID=A0ABQ4IKS6_9ACTN|nr:hypothetical protein [Micromonospora gifhornensis]GIJ18508.1 hypothetical protein Vgi01_51920 [Micromonospora gifhornensis]
MGRCIAFREAGGVYLQSRAGRNLTGGISRAVTVLLGRLDRRRRLRYTAPTR